MESTIKQKRTKAMDMRFYWVQDRVNQHHLKVKWQPGATNYADYFTKHHPPTHHRAMRGTYLVNVIAQFKARILRGCVNPNNRSAGARG